LGCELFELDWQVIEEAASDSGRWHFLSSWPELEALVECGTQEKVVVV